MLLKGNIFDSNFSGGLNILWVWNIFFKKMQIISNFSLITVFLGSSSFYIFTVLLDLLIKIMFCFLEPILDKMKNLDISC